MSTHDTDSAHAEDMKALQAEQRRKVQETGDPGRGLILVHTGDGKGKSSSAFGVAARALGWGHRVAVVQFIKGDWLTGEKQFFDRFPDQLTWRTMGQGFTWDTQNREKDMAAAAEALAIGRGFLDSGEYDLVVLDEINVALAYDYLDVAAVVDALAARATRTSVVLTGRGAKEAIVDAADLVTEMKEVKHPFQAGIKAQKGIDY